MISISDINILAQARNFKKESLNKSFNFYGINDPKKTFYSAEKISEFKKTKSFINEINYLDFLKNNLKRNMLNWFDSIAKEWHEKDPNLETQEDKFLYIVKKFIVDPLTGLKTEEFIKKFFKEKVFSVINPTKEEDANQCVDLFIKRNNKTVAIQVKPISFFIGINGVTKNSFIKIKKAKENYSLNTFLVYFDEEKNKANVLVRSKDGFCKFIDGKEFILIFEEKFSIETINKISNETFTNLEKTSKIHY